MDAYGVQIIWTNWLELLFSIYSASIRGVLGNGLMFRGVLTKMFFRNFGIISGFVTVGITCRLRISGLGPVSYWYHDTDL